MRPHPSLATNASVAACAPADVTAVGGGGQVERCVIPSDLSVHEHERGGEQEGGDRERRPPSPARCVSVSVSTHGEGSSRRGAAEDRYAIAARIAIAAVVIGVFLTWTADDPVTLNGTQGPNNGWLAVIVAAFALGWT